MLLDGPRARRVLWLAASILLSCMCALCEASESAGAPSDPPSIAALSDPASHPDADAQRGRREPSTRSGIVHSWESGEGQSYLVPALEVPGLIILLNGFDRIAFPNKVTDGKHTYRTNLSTIWEHLHQQHWGFDHDTFEVNQVGHPYEGASFYGLARSSGLNFWESWGYSNAGSFLWEMAGETSRPSINDIITTGNAGTLVGEALFRMAGVVLEDGGETPGVWHEVAAAVISPPTGFNRLAFGERFRGVFPGHKPANFWRLRLGAGLEAEGSDRGYGDAAHNVFGTADFSLGYGLPGKPGYSYRRPLDYFDFRLTVRSRADHFLENVLLRGLLIGSPYEGGDAYRGIWGLYGSYDYISPFMFQVSSTALSLGTTGELAVAPGVTLQGSALGGMGFAAAGTHEERAFHYGATPQWLLSLNLLLGERAYVDLAARGYYLQGIERDVDGSEILYNCDAGVTFRISGRHGVGVRWVESLRSTHYQQLANRHQREGTVSLFYTFLSNNARFGAVRQEGR